MGEAVLHLLPGLGHRHPGHRVGDEDGVVAEAAAAGPALRDAPLHRPFEEMGPVVQQQGHDRAEAGGAGRVRDLGELGEELGDVRVEIMARGGVAGGMDAGRAAERVDLEAAVVGEAVEARPQPDIFRFLEGVGTKRVPRFRDFFRDAEVGGREQFEVRSEDFRRFAQLPEVAGGKY